MPLLFENIITTNHVTIDIDMYIGDWEDTQKETALKKITELERRFNIKVNAFYRHSSSDNVHILLVFPFDLAMLDVFIIRSYFKDDPVRLILDMHRYYRTGDVDKMNRCFDEKIHITSGVKRAGEWIPIKEKIDRINVPVFEVSP